MIRKLILKNGNLKFENLRFEMTNRSVFKLDEKFGNFGEVVNGIMYNKNLYNNSLKLISCTCITRELDVEELMDNLEPKQITTEIVPLATQIYLDYMGVKTEEEKKEGKTEKK